MKTKVKKNLFLPFLKTINNPTNDVKVAGIKACGYNV